MLRRRKNRKRLQKAYLEAFWEVAELELKIEADPGLTCPAYVTSSAWTILTQELDSNPVWSSRDLREEDASRALLCLTRWLDAGIETLLTGDRKRGDEHAARFVPLPLDLDARMAIDLDVDSCYWRVGEVMGDSTAEIRGRIVSDLGGDSGLWRIWVGASLEVAKDSYGRARGPIAGWVCPIHPPATS